MIVGELERRLDEAFLSYGLKDGTMSVFSWETVRPRSRHGRYLDPSTMP